MTTATGCPHPVDLTLPRYVEMYAGLSSGIGDIVFDVDAGLGPGKVITLLHHPDLEMHMIYEAVCSDLQRQRKRSG
ncbi:hypothetical protein JRI60_17005 [Archangium violaceum]|uniref:hypothetical protein n=1 Tax=Archangium violaceum TaxID=83451 RepID=UPI001951F1FE|nr:hypothetical protein [Archangium violaceum]QRO00606.1 hypothetical protein JRI60_17005 [Archangium violaceum]